MARCERVQRVLQQWMVRACSGAPDSLLPFYRNARAMQRQGRQGNAPWHSKRRRRTCTSCWQPISGCPALSVQPTRNNIAIGPCQPRLPALPQLHLPRSERRLRCIAARLVEHSSSMFAKAAQALCLLLLASAASAYPNLFTSMHANACGDQPTSALGSHGAPRPDRCGAPGWPCGNAACVAAPTHRRACDRACTAASPLTSPRQLGGPARRCARADSTTSR